MEDSNGPSVHSERTPTARPSKALGTNQSNISCSKTKRDKDYNIAGE